jgi:hypothetical protein
VEISDAYSAASRFPGSLTFALIARRRISDVSFETEEQRKQDEAKVKV